MGIVRKSELMPPVNMNESILRLQGAASELDRKMKIDSLPTCGCYQ